MATDSSGAAKDSLLVAIKALDCSGSGTVSSVASAIVLVQEWCSAAPDSPAVLTMSLSGSKSSTLDSAVTSLQAACHISIVAAAGNQADNACNYSPGDVPACLTVAASDPDDSLAYYSNFGSCVDLKAPGGDGGANPITGASDGSDSATMQASGTSAACPISAGVAAILIHQRMASGYQLGSDNVGTLTNQEIVSHLGNGVLFAYFVGTIQALNAPPPPAPQPPPPSPPRVIAGAPQNQQSMAPALPFIALGLLAWILWL